MITRRLRPRRPMARPGDQPAAEQPAERLRDTCAGLASHAAFLPVRDDVLAKTIHGLLNRLERERTRYDGMGNMPPEVRAAHEDGHALLARLRARHESVQQALGGGSA